MSKQYTVVISKTANQMLLEHAAFIARVSETAAHDFVQEFQKKAISLRELPERCPWIDDSFFPKRKYRKLLLKKYYLILYQVYGDHVYIDSVIDCRQDYRWLITLEDGRSETK